MLVPEAIQRFTVLEYPFHHRTILVTRCGRICMGAMKINLSTAFACRIESAANPFAAKVLPMCPE